MTSPEESRFDEELRRSLADFEASPPPDGWQVLQQSLPTPPPARPGRLARLRPFGAGVVAGALLWWGGAQLNQPASPSTEAPAQGTTVETAVPKRHAPTVNAHSAADKAIADDRNPVSVDRDPISIERNAVSQDQDRVSNHQNLISTARNPVSKHQNPIKALANPVSPAQNPIAVIANPSTPVRNEDSAKDDTKSLTAEANGNGGPVLSPTVRQIVRLDTALHHTLMAAATPERNARVRALVAEQQAALAAAQQSLDSLKESLRETPPALAGPADSTQQSAPAPAADWHHFPAPRNPWSVVALLETTPHWSVLPTQGPTPDQEQTQAALAQSLQLQRQLNPRWRVRGGFGQAQLQTQARYTSLKSGERTTIDSSTTTTIIDVTRHEDYITIIRVDSVLRLEPVLNGNGQVIRYDTLWVPKNDTLITPRVTYDTTTKIVKVYRQTTERWSERRQQQLRPEYRFWTIPLNVQYLLVSRNRWSLGLNLGTQITVFRGGTRPVWNGDEYVMRRVSPRDGPYRPVSFSLSTGLEAQYRLTPRLSVLLAPTLRWWAVPAAKGTRATARTLLPAGQVGLSYGLW